MLISAKTMQPISIFFSPEEAQLQMYYLGNYKIYQPEILQRQNARAEKPYVGYHGTP